MQEGKPASVKWRVKETNGNMRIVDIIIENVSLAQTSRSEYTSYIQKSPNGIDGLIADLKAKLK
jgi:phospholipid transport system substrate-binding protein